MPATAVCPTCQVRFEVADEAAETSLTCPGCGSAVPSAIAVAAPVEVLPLTPRFRVVAIGEERDIVLPPRPAAAPEPPPEYELRQRDPLGLTGCLVRLAALGAVCVATAAGLLLWEESSLVMISLYAIGLLVVVSVGNLLMRHSRQPAGRTVGAVILIVFALAGIAVLMAAAFLFLVSCLVSLGPGSRYPY